MNDNQTDDDTPIIPIPAATLVLFRHRADGAPELLVVERSAKMAFAGGAIVFPGGRIDPDDHAIGELHDIETEEAAARIAAIRETLEESGLAIGFGDIPDADWIAEARARLHNREPFSAILPEGGRELDLDALIPFARWCPPFREARVFDTRFYIARAPDDAPDPIVDETENVSSFWASAGHVLEAADAGRVNIIFPTRRNLERLAQFDHFDHAAAHARAIPVETVKPYFEERDGVMCLCIPDHLGYPVTFEAATTVRRGMSRPD
jgi:8-oxo-dGTP pyrophosphatase MutT (NUDIX family)